MYPDAHYYVGQVSKGTAPSKAPAGPAQGQSMERFPIPRGAITDVPSLEEVPLAGIPPELAVLGAAGSAPARYASRQTFSRGRRLVEQRLGTTRANAESLFRHARVMGEFFVRAGLVEREPFVVAREDTPLADHMGFRSAILAWVPGGGFAYMVGVKGHYRVLEVYRTPDEICQGILTVRLLASAARGFQAEDAGERLLRLQENARKLRELELETGTASAEKAVPSPPAARGGPSGTPRKRSAPGHSS